MEEFDEELDEIVYEDDGHHGRAARVFRPRVNNSFEMERKFVDRFRMSEMAMDFLEERLEHLLAPDTERSHALTTRQRVCFAIAD